MVAPWVKPEGEEEAEPPPPEPVKVSFTFPGEEEPVETEPVEPGEDGAVVFDYVKALEGRVAGPALVSALIGTPLVVTVHRGEAAIATASVDMFAFTTGVESIGGSYALAKIPFEGDLPKPEPEAPPEGEEPPAEADAGGEGEDAVAVGAVAVVVTVVLVPTVLGTMVTVGPPAGPSMPSPAYQSIRSTDHW